MVNLLIFAVMEPKHRFNDIKNESPLSYRDDINAFDIEYAQNLDAQDPLRNFRDEFIIPSKKDLKRKNLAFEQGIYNVSHK